MNTSPVPPSAEPEQDLSGLVGYRLMLTYMNGWKYELYIKDSRTIDYRVHGGVVAGRWVKDQPVDIHVLDADVYKISAHEPTGSCLVLNLFPAKRRVFATIFFPQWVQENPQATAMFQNEHLDHMRELRDAGPTYPMSVLPMSGTITLLEYVGENNEAVISSLPSAEP